MSVMDFPLFENVSERKYVENEYKRTYDVR